MEDLPPQHGLDGVGIFASLEPAERARLAAELETLELKRGDVLVRQGEVADALYIVVTGRFAVTLDGRRQLVAELGPGQPIGEIAFLAGGARTATVTALRDSLVLRLGRADFEALCAKSPGIWRALTVALASRVAEGNVGRPDPPDPRPRTIAIIRAGGSPLPEPFVAQLADVFRRGSNTRLLRSETAREVLPNGVALDSAEATHLLNALESRHDYVLFVADAELTRVVGEGDPSGGPGARRRLGGRGRAAQCAGAAGRGASAARRPAARAAARCPCAHLGHRPLARPPPHRHASPRGTGRARRLRAALSLHQRHGAGPRCLRRRRLLRVPHRPLQGRGGIGPRLRHHGRHLGRRRDDGGLRHGHRARRCRPRHARDLRHQPRHAPLHLAALQPPRPHPLRPAARALLRRRQHRGPVDPLLRGLDQPVELRPAPPPPGRPVGRGARHRIGAGAAAALLHARTARCWSTAPSSTTCPCA